MKLQHAASVLVVGALLVGGATTGTTLALWRDSATAATSSVSGGTVKLTGSDGTTTANIPLGSASAITAGATGAAGTPVVVPVTLKHATPTSSKNMRMTVTLDGVSLAAGSGAGLTGALQVAAAPRAGASCPATTTATYNDVAAATFATPPVLATALDRQTDAPICVYVRMKANAGAGAQNQSGSLTFSFRGTQVRP